MQINEPNSVRFLLARISRVASAVLAVGALITPYTAFAFFNASAVANGNTLSAATLSYTLSANALSATIMQQATSTVSFTTSSTGDIAPQYRLSAQKGACADAFYNGLTVAVNQGGLVYAGPVATLAATSSQSGTWQISIAAGSAIASAAETCQVQLHLDAWQPEFASLTMGGFTESNVITLTLTADDYLGRTVVLNEILPNPSPSASAPANQEFVELYNLSSNPVDVAGWKISEISGSSEEYHTIVASSTSSGDMVVYSGSTIVAAHGWLVLVFSGTAPYLDNNGDTVRLYDGSAALRDAFTYTSSTQGKSDGRLPDGSGAWADPIPTPGGPNTDAPFVQSSLLAVVNSNNASSTSDTTTAITTSTSTTPTDLMATSPENDVASSTPIVSDVSASSTPDTATSTPVINPIVLVATSTTLVEVASGTTFASTTPAVMPETDTPVTPPVVNAIKANTDMVIPAAPPTEDSTSTAPATS